MDLKDYNVGKFIDNTFSQLLHYLLPKKNRKKGSLADKLWVKKMKTTSPLVALGVLIFMIILCVMSVSRSPIASGFVLFVGVIFLFLILVCFACIGIAALIKRDGSIFYLYLVKISIWAFCGSLLLFGVGTLMSLKENSHKTEVSKTNNQNQSKTQPKSIVDTNPTSSEETMRLEVFRLKKQIDANSGYINELQKALSNEKEASKSLKEELVKKDKQLDQDQHHLYLETEKTKSLENKLRNESLHSSKTQETHVKE